MTGYPIRLLLIFSSLLSFYAAAQKVTVSGKVTDNQGGNLPFVSVSVKGQNKGLKPISMAAMN